MVLIFFCFYCRDFCVSEFCFFCLGISVFDVSVGSFGVPFGKFFVLGFSQLPNYFGKFFTSRVFLTS